MLATLAISRQETPTYRAEAILLYEVLPHAIDIEVEAAPCAAPIAMKRRKICITMITDDSTVEHQILWLFSNGALVGKHWSGRARVSSLPTDVTLPETDCHVYNVTADLYKSLDSAICGLSRPLQLADLRRLRGSIRRKVCGIIGQPTDTSSSIPKPNWDPFGPLWATISMCFRWPTSVRIHKLLHTLPPTNTAVAQWLKPLKTRHARTFALSLEPTAISVALTHRGTLTGEQLDRCLILLRRVETSGQLRAAAMAFLQVGKVEIRYLNSTCGLARLDLAWLPAISNIVPRLPPQFRPKTLEELRRLLPQVRNTQKHFEIVFDPSLTSDLPEQALRNSRRAFWKSSNRDFKRIATDKQSPPIHSISSSLASSRFLKWFTGLEAKAKTAAHLRLAAMGSKRREALSERVDQGIWSLTDTQAFMELAELRAGEVWSSLGMPHKNGCPVFFNPVNHDAGVTVEPILGSGAFRRAGSTLGNCLAGERLWHYLSSTLIGKMFTYRIDEYALGHSFSARSIFTVSYKENQATGLFTLSEHRSIANQPAEYHAPIAQLVLEQMQIALLKPGVHRMLHVGRLAVRAALRELLEHDGDRLRDLQVELLCVGALLPHFTQAWNAIEINREPSCQ